MNYRNYLLAALAAFLVTACDSPEEKHAKYMERGDEYFAEQDYVHARLEYKNAAKVSPTDPRVIYSLGLVEEAQGNLQAALSAFLTAEQQDPDFEPVIQKLAEFFLTVQQDEEAKIRVYRLLSINPDNAMAHAINASIYLKRKDLVQGKEEAELALKLDKKNVVAYSVLAGIAVAQKRNEEALVILDRGLVENPDEISLYLLKGIVYANQGDTAKVREVYAKIFALSPKNIRYRFDLATILSDAGRGKDAEDILRAAIIEFPSNDEAKRQMVALLEKTGGMPAAETEIKSYLHSAPTQTTLYLWLAELYLRNKREDLAVSALNSILGARTDEWVSLSANTSMARIKLSQGDIDFANKLVGEVLAKDINNNDALFLRANLAFTQGDYDQALADLRNVVRDNPKGAGAARLMAEIFVSQGRPDMAIDTLLQHHTQVPDDLGAQVRLAQLHALRGDRKQALDILDQILKNNASYSVAWETLARLFIEDKQFDRAQQALTRLQSVEDQKPVAIFLEGQAAAAKGEDATAMERYKQVISSYPGTPLVEHALAAMLPLAQSSGTLADLESFLSPLGAGNASMMAALGGVQAALGKHDEAIETLRAAIALKPKEQAVYISLAQLLKDRGDIAGAIDVLQKAEAALPGESKAALMRADMLVQKGDTNGGIAIYRALLARNKGSQFEDIIANNFAQGILDHKGSGAEAYEEARIIAERFMNSANPYYLDTLGWVYFKQGNFAQAEPILKKAVSLLQQPNAQVDYHYGALLYALGRKVEAKDYLVRAVKGSAYMGQDEAKRLLGNL